MHISSADLSFVLDSHIAQAARIESLEQDVQSYRELSQAATNQLRLMTVDMKRSKDVIHMLHEELRQLRAVKA